MIRFSRKMLANSAWAGLLLTALVAAADVAGLLDRLERWLYDERVLHCQYFMTPPTDSLIHVDIDDAALESIERWPWQREKMAQILDEIHVAGPKAVAMDVLYTEPQEVQWVRAPDGSFSQIDNDAELSGSLKHLGNVVIPASFSFPEEKGLNAFIAARDLLIEDPELHESEVAARLHEGSLGKVKNLDDQVREVFLAARRQAMYVRIRRELGDEKLPAKEIRPRILKNTEAGLRTAVVNVFDEQYLKSIAALELRQFAKPIPPTAPVLFKARLSLAPIAPLIRSAATSGFVDYPPSKDGKVRAVPLFIESEGKMYPQIGLSLACQALGTDLRSIRFEPGKVIIPRAGLGDLAIPVRTLRKKDLDDISHDIPLTVDLPWFGGTDWKSMYDRSHTGMAAQHVPIVSVWEICRTRQKIQQNARQADDALKFFYELWDKDKLHPFELHPPALDDFDRRQTVITAALKDYADFVQGAEDAKPEERTEDDRKVLASVNTLRLYMNQTPRLQEQLQSFRKTLHDQLNGKAVLIGWMATAAIADFFPTSLHARCPGVVIHGVVYNAIMNGEVWRVGPRWITLVITLLIGGIMTAVVSFLSPGKALVSAMVLALGYLLVNGLLLFDYGNLIVGAAGPLMVIGVVWSGGTLMRLVTERAQRDFIRRRFRAYVDPSLVDAIEENPGQVKIEGERRDMTVIFLDLVGFTKMTEKLGEQTVTILNELWGYVVPAIREHGGFVNKFLGDGIMFFYGAPRPQPDHARRAIDTLLDLRPIFTKFNEQSAERGVPHLGVRFGVASGDMIVGDAGGGETSDYTVLGDNVNLSARLESANKQTGTSNLITARTIQTCSTEGLLLRPIARLRVVGKAQGVMTYEVMGRIAEATEDQKKLAHLTEEMVDAYIGGNFDTCLAAAQKLDAAFGDSKLTHLYQENAERQLSDPDPGFDGTVTLTEK